MANGDDALAAGMDILNGNEDRREGYDEINKTRDYIAQRTSAVTPIEKGGTGATTAETARAALGIPEIAPPNSAEAGELPIYNANGQLTTANPTLGGHAASKQYADSVAASAAASARQFNDDGLTYSVTGRHLRVSGNILSTTGTFYAEGASPATSGWTIAYIDGDGRLAKGASSERYKKYISEIDPADLGDIWPDLVRYQMRNGDGAWKYGYIAERLAESEDLAPFVVYADLGTGPIPDSIDFIALLMAQTAQLHAELLAEREARLALEERIIVLEAR